MSSCEIKFLNKPSKQAVYNFHRAYYELFKDVLEGRCTMRTEKENYWCQAEL